MKCFTQVFKYSK